jgi:hypothetical protein
MAASVAIAAPRARPLAQVAPFAIGRALAEEELGYFGPEVARAVAAALESAGVDVGPGGEWSVTGRIDGVEGSGGERVRLVAMTRGRTVAVEGTLETVDQLAGQLAARLVPVLVEGDPRAGRVVGARLQAAAKEAPPFKDHEPIKDAHAKEATAPSPAPRAPVVVVVAPSPAAPPEQLFEKVPDRAPERAPERVGESRPPDMRPSAQAYPPPGYQPWGGYVAGRVVAHAIPDPPSAYVGTGVAATQALYSFLGRRLRLAVVPTGVGVSSPLVAADEGWRAAARSVIMTRIESIDYLPGAMGLSVRVRLQVVVVREGRVVFRRVQDSPLSDPARRTDPIYQAVSGALEPLANELAAAVAGQ